MTVVGRPKISKRAHFALTALLQEVRRTFQGRSVGHSTIALRITEVILVVLLCVLLALIGLRIFSPLPLPSGEPIISDNQNITSSQNVLVKNPFPVTEVVTIREETVTDVVDTTLDLILTGVWVVEDGGSATIETPDGEQSRFAVGDEIINGVSLETVYPDQVIINRNGARESLRFESKLVASAPIPSPSVEQDITPIRNLANANGGAAAFTNFLRLAPATDDDGNFAVDIYAARDRQTFNNYGFRDGDRVVSINGTPPPSNPAALIAMMNALQRDAQAVIVVSRDDQEIPITLSVDGGRTQ